VVGLLRTYALGVEHAPLVVDRDGSVMIGPTSDGTERFSGDALGFVRVGDSKCCIGHRVVFAGEPGLMLDMWERDGGLRSLLFQLFLNI
jgi:hypothetical protein